MRTLIPLFVFLWSASAVFAAMTHYAATNGMTGNTGLSTNSPWPLAYALQHVGDSNTVIVMDGTYSGANYWITNSWITLKAQNKWKASLANSPGNVETLLTYPPGVVNGVTIDGLEITHSGGNGITIEGTNCTVRNCWIHHSGVGSAGRQYGSGIFTLNAQNNTTVEYNLIEYNGADANYDHGMYISGTNCIIRNNVCRYNKASGIQIYTGVGGSSNCKVYNNLVYGNGWGAVFNFGDQMYLYANVSGVTNYVFNNSIISTNARAVNTSALGTWCFTNNIILSTSDGIFSGATVQADYNLARSALAFAGPHDIISPIANFVGPSKGLYWLSSGSPARNAAKSLSLPADFFGNPTVTVSDIGAFQYNAANAADSRVLDPSPAKPDYWANLAGMNGGGALLPPANLRILAGP